MNHSLVPVVLFLGAACLANLAAMGVVICKLESVEEKLLEMHDLQVGLLRLQVQLAPKDAPGPKPEPRAVAD